MKFNSELIRIMVFTKYRWLKNFLIITRTLACPFTLDSKQFYILVNPNTISISIGEIINLRG